MPSRREFLCLAGAVTLAGCAAPVAQGPPPWWAPYVRVAPDLVARGFRRLALVRARNDGGFLRITGSWVNVSPNRLSVLYRFTWLDAAGQPVETLLSAWEATHVRAGTQVEFAGTAPRDDIDAFRLEFVAANADA